MRPKGLPIRTGSETGIFTASYSFPHFGSIRSPCLAQARVNAPGSQVINGDTVMLLGSRWQKRTDSRFIHGCLDAMGRATPVSQRSMPLHGYRRCYMGPEQYCIRLSPFSQNVV